MAVLGKGYRDTSLRHATAAAATSPVIRVAREEHAAHDLFSGAALYDLEWYHVRQEWGAPRPVEVPPDAERHSGYVGDDGEQVVLWFREASARRDLCDRCRRRAA
jgi:hypothetical protein